MATSVLSTQGVHPSHRTLDGALATAALQPPRPDEGIRMNNRLTQTASDQSTWQDRYVKARRRVQVLTVSTVVASTIAVGALVWGVTHARMAAAVEAGIARLIDGGQPLGLAPDAGLNPLRGARNGAGLVDRLFTDAGAVDAERVERLAAQLPDGVGPTTVVELWLAQGVVTEEQADALLDAFRAADATPE
jgi:hypothetical protein